MTRRETTLVERRMGEPEERPLEEERQPVRDRPEPEEPPVTEPFAEDDEPYNPPPLRA